MDIYNEPIPYQNPALCIKVWRFRGHAYHPRVPVAAKPGNPKWHYHKEVEFVLSLNGVHEIHTPKQMYRLHPGDVALVGASQLHRGVRVAGEVLDIIVLHVDLEPYFDPAMMNYYRHFSEINAPLEELNYIFRESPHVKEEVAAIIVRIHKEMMERRHGYEIAASMHIKHLLLTLLRGDSKRLLQQHEYVDPTLLRPIIEFVDAHLHEKIEMEQVSQLAGMSYSYFSKYFKKSIGISFTDYVNRKRIAKAERLLATGHLNITEIAQSVGIENMAHFYEMFKRFNGCTPKQYSRKLETSNSSALPAL